MPFLPLYDRNPRLRIGRPWVTWGLIAACAFVFYLETAADPDAAQRMIYGYGLTPAVLLGKARMDPAVGGVSPILSLATYMFLHGGFMHLIGNMLYLWVFGDNVEDSMGHRRFVAFYLICGVVAALVQTALAPGATAPMIGASGAVSGILGAYLILHPRARILVPIIVIPVWLPAYVLIIFWFVFQLAAAFGGGGAGVAWWAHIGGFVAGVALVIVFRDRSLPLFGGGNRLPGGLRFRERDADTTDRPAEKRRRPGPWG
ncbi:MAG: rhomboid family intramembrane serine protease [Alphaproteobacteria bacterium]